jgi:hypothetical protein
VVTIWLVPFLLLLLWLLVPAVRRPGSDEEARLLGLLAATGDAFGTLNALLSALGIAAILFTLWIQLREFKRLSIESDRRGAEEAWRRRVDDFYRVYDVAQRLLDQVKVRPVGAGEGGQRTAVEMARAVIAKVREEKETMRQHNGAEVRRAVADRLWPLSDDCRLVYDSVLQFFRCLNRLNGVRQQIGVGDLDEAARDEARTVDDLYKLILQEDDVRIILQVVSLNPQGARLLAAIVAKPADHDLDEMRKALLGDVKADSLKGYAQRLRNEGAGDR